MVDAEGRYTADTANVEYDITQMFGSNLTGLTTEMTVSMTARRVGGC
jgi:hypothetical protein